MAPECTKFINRIGEMIAQKRNEKYADVVRCLRTKIRFSLLKSTLVALRGFQGNPKTYETELKDISFNLIPDMPEIEIV